MISSSAPSAAIPRPSFVDIYGFNAMYRFGNWLGQDAEGDRVDCRCGIPMEYHVPFRRPVFPALPGKSTVQESSDSASGPALSPERALRSAPICSLQDALSLMGSGYLRPRTGAVRDGGGVSGFTSGTRRGYDMVRRARGGRPPAGNSAGVASRTQDSSTPCRCQ